MWLDYCADLATCRLDEIEIAIREYRLNPKEKFYPKSSQLREIVFANRKHRAELARLGEPIRKTERRPTLWWMQAKIRWPEPWREHEVPAGELIRDAVDGPYREPVRA